MALHLAALSIAVTAIGRETVGPGPDATRHVLQLAARVPPIAAVAQAPADPPTPRAPPPPPPVEAKRRPDATPAIDDRVSSRRPFYEFREVDVPAEPVDEWGIDPAALDALATSRIVFTLFVSSDGTPLYCSVDEPTRLTVAMRRALADRLCATAMRPALRNGVAVASRRRVELFTTGGL